MKKLLFALFAVALMPAYSQEQEFTFQGLPWGATREQVIERFGEPIGESQDELRFPASVNGFLSEMVIGLSNNGMQFAGFEIGRIQGLNTIQLTAAFIVISERLRETYGEYHEIIAEGWASSRGYIRITSEEKFVVWNFNNFHVILPTITENSQELVLLYVSTYEWLSQGSSIEPTGSRIGTIRFPNRGL